MSLKSKTVKGTAWSFLDNIANQGVSFGVGIVLANLLTPEEYGLIGVILIFIAVFNAIVDSGFSNALIRRNDIGDSEYNTVFIANLGMSILLFLVMFIGAPQIGRFFKQPELVSLTRVMGIVIIINAFAIIQRTILIKQINFKLQTKISLVSSLFSGAIGIGMAIFGFGVWSWVGQQISRQSINTFLLWMWNSWRPRIYFSTRSFRELFGFGWKLMLSTIIDTTWKEVYQIVIGKFYSPAMLGLYTRAKQFDTIFSSNLTSVVQRVSYPVLSSIREDKARLKSAYKKVIKITMLVSFCCMLGMAAIADSMIHVLIGEKWMAAVPMLQILCFQLMLYPLHALNLNMLQIEGRSDLFLKLEIIKKTISVGPILIGIFVGIYWMLAASVVTGFISYYLNAFYSVRLLGYSISEQVWDILPSFLIAIIAALITYGVSFIPVSCYIMLPLQLIIGFFVLISILEVAKLAEYMELKSIFKNTYSKLCLSFR